MSYIPIEELGYFKKKICLKSKSVDEVSGSSFGPGTKVIIIVISTWAIVTTILSIISYVNILKEPDSDEKLADGWCISMIVLNGSLLIASIIIFFVVILSFKGDSDKKKAVIETINGSKEAGAVEGALVASLQASNDVINATAIAAAQYAFQNSAAALGSDEARRLGSGALTAGFTAGNAIAGSAAQRATSAVGAAAANGTLNMAAAAAAQQSSTVAAQQPRTLTEATAQGQIGGLVDGSRGLPTAAPTAPRPPAAAASPEAVLASVQVPPSIPPRNVAFDLS
jgi:hypothetical protein